MPAESTRAAWTKDERRESGDGARGLGEVVARVVRLQDKHAARAEHACHLGESTRVVRVREREAADDHVERAPGERQSLGGGPHEGDAGRGRVRGEQLAPRASRFGRDVHAHADGPAP